MYDMAKTTDKRKRKQLISKFVQVLDEDDVEELTEVLCEYGFDDIVLSCMSEMDDASPDVIVGDEAVVSTDAKPANDAGNVK